tara:strand:- start:593 stop:742 length:150 start_codon:yes stop_codon:yes gene_type:complete
MAHIGNDIVMDIGSIYWKGYSLLNPAIIIIGDSYPVGKKLTLKNQFLFE